MGAQLHLLEVPRSSCAGHEGLPQPTAAVSLVVGEALPARLVSVVGEEEGLDHRLVDHRGDDGEGNSEVVHGCLVETQVTLRCTRPGGREGGRERGKEGGREGRREGGREGGR